VTLDANLKEYLSLKQLEDVATSLCRFFVGKTSQKQIIQRIKQYIQENYKDSSLCLSKLSDQFHLSESYLSYLFKEVTGENFSNYLEQIRMEKALQLVHEKQINLSDIYYEVGYNNANSFRRAFKKTYGMSAKEMRTSNQSLKWSNAEKI
jgi:two-component system response regulator YesN